MYCHKDGTEDEDEQHAFLKFGRNCSCYSTISHVGYNNIINGKNMKSGMQSLQEVKYPQLASSKAILRNVSYLFNQEFMQGIALIMQI